MCTIFKCQTLLYSEFIDQVNKYDGHEMEEDDLRQVKRATLEAVSKIYRKTSKKNWDALSKDLTTIIRTICDIAYGRVSDLDIPHMNIGQYAKYMGAPHRIDLMVSSMKQNGKWYCNQRCMNCYAGGQYNADVPELSTKEWKIVIDNCRKANIPQLTFTGGEPTLRNDLVELIEYSKWFVTRLNTNGQLLSKELCSQLYDASLDSIQITLYTATEKEHSVLTGSIGLEKTVQGIKNALEAGLNVSINTPLCKLNRDYVKTLEFLKSLGVEYVSCSGIIYTGKAREKGMEIYQLSEDELYDVVEQATKFCNENHMEIAFTSSGLISDQTLMSLKLDVPTCGACMSNMAIAPNGDVVPCQSWLDENSSLGNMLTDNWKKIGMRHYAKV